MYNDVRLYIQQKKKDQKGSELFLQPCSTCIRRLSPPKDSFEYVASCALFILQYESSSW